MDDDNLQRELVKYGRLLVERYKAQLKIDNTYATGKTSKSLDYSITDGELTILSDISLKYIDQGRDAGNMPSANDILRWAESKGIKPRDGQGKFIKVTDRSLFWMANNIAKAIGEKGTIKRFGYNGSGIIEFVYGRTKNEMIDNIFLAYADDVDNMIKEIVK